MKVAIYGVGYVGLVQGAVLAEVGHDVLCIDIDAIKINRLKQGYIPIYEPGLENLVRENFKKGRLRFSTEASEGVNHGDIQFIAVGTPPDEDGSADLQYVLKVSEKIALNMTTPKVIVNKSTVPVGTADKVKQRVQEILKERGMGELNFDVISNPEFLKEGSAVTDCMRPDRIIIGISRPESEDVMRELYAPFNRNHEKIIIMDVRSAELTKYAANCMLATKISFINEMANIAEFVGADIEMVRHGIGSDPRIGYSFIYPGVGYGGSCFPKDVQALIRTTEGIGFDAKILKAVEKRNNIQKTELFNKIEKYFKNNLEGKTFAIWGLAFKPNTDDMREAPSRVLIDSLIKANARVKAYDPEAISEAHRIYQDNYAVTLCDTKEETLYSADALVIVTEWAEFKSPDFEFIKKTIKYPVIFDGRNLFNPQKLTEEKLDYYAIGRNPFVNK